MRRSPKDAMHCPGSTTYMWIQRLCSVSATAIDGILFLLLLRLLFQTQRLVIPLEVFVVLWEKNKLYIST